MSIQTVSASPSTSKADLDAKTLKTSNQWRRNPQWLTLPTVLSSEQKMVGLNAIFPSSNFIALVASGDYTVDWGDGVTENFASDVVAYHEYDYTNSAFDGTLTDAGYKQAIVTVTPQAGQNLTYLNLNQKHNQSGLQAYASGFLDISVSSSELTNLMVASATPDGFVAGINFNLLQQFNLINSDCKQLGYILYATRSLQSIGNFVTSADAPVVASVAFTDASNLVTLSAHGFRDGDGVIFTSITSTTGIVINRIYYIINATTDTFQVSLSYGGSAINLVNDGVGTVVYGTTMQSAFRECSSLSNIALFDTSNVIDMNTMFNNTNLQTVPLFNTSNVIDMNTMFSGVRFLASVPLFNTVNVTNMSSMFNGCGSLTTVPLFDTYNVTNMNTMFSNTSLQTVPLFNTSNVTNMNSMFNGVRSLLTVPLLNTSNVTNMSSMFTGCAGLLTVPLFDTSNVTSALQMFSTCRSLQNIPLLDTSSLTDARSMFNNCNSLNSIPALVTTAISSSTYVSGMFGSCSSLTRIEAKDFRFTFSVANCKLSSTALNEIYTNLPTVTGQTITVTGNYGVTGDDPTIATAKGWTVTG